jgi:hypothetical protein
MMKVSVNKKIFRSPYEIRSNVVNVATEKDGAVSDPASIFEEGAQSLTFFTKHPCEFVMICSKYVLYLCICVSAGFDGQNLISIIISLIHHSNRSK